MLVGVLARVEVSGRQLVAGRRLQLELLSAGGSQVVRLRVKVESPGDGQGSDDLITWMKTGVGGRSFTISHTNDADRRKDWGQTMRCIVVTSGEVTKA